MTLRIVILDWQTAQCNSVQPNLSVFERNSDTTQKMISAISSLPDAMARRKAVARRSALLFTNQSVMVKLSSATARRNGVRP